MRARLLLALLAAAAATLLVAAAALLSPLQDRLRDQSRTALRSAALSARGQIDAALRAGRVEDARRMSRALGTRTNSIAVLYLPNGRGGLAPAPLTGAAEVWRVFAVPATVVRQDEAGISIAIPLAMSHRGGQPAAGGILAVRKQDTSLKQTVGEVRRAFVTAALAGLVVAIVLALVLSATLSRRLGHLRDAARRVVEDGTDAPVPADPRRDEIGDLARAMAEMQAALHRQEDARRRFVSTASHELRTPITALMGTLELLDADLAAPSVDLTEARAQVHAAQADLARLRVLASELLDLSRLDAGVPLRREPVELGELTRAVAAEFAHRAAEARCTLAVIAPPGPCWAGGDPGAIARIARILIDNALRYAHSRVTVTPAYHGDAATVTVADDGPGVALAEREIIFERFRRGQGAGRGPGFGLGLAIGRELATQLGGTLSLDDGAEPGACFVLRLPIDLPAGGQEVTSASGSRIAGVSGASR